MGFVTEKDRLSIVPLYCPMVPEPFESAASVSNVNDPEIVLAGYAGCDAIGTVTIPPSEWGSAAAKVPVKSNVTECATAVVGHINATRPSKKKPNNPEISEPSL